MAVVPFKGNMISVDLLITLLNSVFSFQMMFLWQSLSIPEVTVSNRLYCRNLRKLWIYIKKC